MAMANSKTLCSACQKEKSTYICTGCSKHFCFAHLTEHRQILNKQLDEIINDHDQFQQTIIQQKQNPTNPSLIEQINQWEINSIEKIKQTAQECRQTVINYTNKNIDDIENKFVNLSQQLKKIHEENEFNEKDLNHCQLKLKQITQELIQSSHISIQQDSQSFINKILIISSSSVTGNAMPSYVQLQSIRSPTFSMLTGSQQSTSVYPQYQQMMNTYVPRLQSSSVQKAPQTNYSVDSSEKPRRKPLNIVDPVSHKPVNLPATPSSFAGTTIYENRQNESAFDVTAPNAKSTDDANSDTDWLSKLLSDLSHTSSDKDTNQ